jgi:uncharacterized protein (DUF302 family)/uncharacterized membrane protein YidH (DUF202 family)
VETQERADLRDYLAAERTLLAWIRTGLALMGFGFVVARFGLFLQQLLIDQHLSAVPRSGPSLWFGTALIGAGVLVNLLSGWHHIQLIRAIRPVQSGQLHSTTLAISTAVFLALVGLAMATYLLSLRGSTDLQSTVASLAGERGNNEERPVTPGTHKGIIDKPSNHPVDQTVETLKTLLQSKGVTLFAVVDHSGEAAKVGMNLRPTKLLIFGSPKAGTPLMLAAPSTAIDLPLKILVWEDPRGKTWISYNSPQYLHERHGFPPELLANIAVIETLAAAAAQ